MQIRYYQEQAIHSLYNYFSTKTGNPIVAMPTGTGKSVVIAKFLESVFHYFPGQRILILTHVKELIEQNYEKFMSIWPLAPAGVYSAGLRRREVRPITFAGIGSVVKRAKELGHFDLVFIDECHLVSPKQETSYQNLIADLQKINPGLKVVGLTATPYRMEQGLLTDPIETSHGPRPSLFTDICFDLTDMDSFNRLIVEGFLCPLIPKRTGHELDLTGVKIQGGKYNLSDLQIAVDRDIVTRHAIDEILEQCLAESRTRTRLLVFASGVEHAEHIAEEFRQRGIAAEVVSNKTSDKDRRRIVEWIKTPNEPGYENQVKVLVNNGVFTTGFDCPEIDLIAVLRPTMSASLWVQMLGRGTRPSPGKPNCLVLDFAGNTKRLGPINDPVVPRRKGKKGGGEAPVKICEACSTYNHASVRFCVSCGQLFPVAVKIKETAGTAELLRESKAPEVEVFPVDRVEYSPHLPRDPAKQPSLKVCYFSGIRMFSEWVCLEHDGFPGKKARDWWRQRSTYDPPETLEEAHDRLDELDEPSHIRVLVNARHPQILAYDFSGTGFNTGRKSGKTEKNDEDVPF